MPAQLSPRSLPVSPGFAELHAAALREPTSPRPHIELARLYLEVGNIGLAEDEARAAVRLAPEQASAYFSLAGVLYASLPADQEARRARLEEAYAVIGRGMELHDDNADALLLAATLALELNHLDESRRYLSAVTLKGPDRAPLLILEGRLAARAHRYTDARDLFVRAEQLAPAQGYGAWVAWATFMAGDEPGAVGLYKAVPEARLRLDDRLALTALALRRGAYDEAEAQLRAGYVRTEQLPVLVKELDRITQVRSGRLKASAVADLFDARLALQIDDLDRAERLLRRTLEVDKRVADAPELLAELFLFVRNDPRQAIKVLSDAPDQTVSYRRYHLAIQAFRAMEDAQGAEEILPEFLELVAREVELGNREEARTALETMVLLLPVPTLWQFYVDLAVEEEAVPSLMVAWETLKATVPRLEPEFTSILGEGLIQLGRLSDAERLLRAQLAREPAHLDTLRCLGLVAERRGDLQSAEEAYRRMTVIRPSEGQAWVLLGDHYLRAGAPDEARGAFEEALRRESELPAALYGLAEALSTLRMFDEAVSAARRLTEVQPRDVAGWLELAEVLGKAQRYAEQGQALREGVKRGQGSAAAMARLATYLVQVPDEQLRNLEEAIQVAHQAVELSHEKDITALETLAEALYQSGRYQDALTAIEKAIGVRPEADQLHRQRRRIRSALDNGLPARLGM